MKKIILVVTALFGFSVAYAEAPPEIGATVGLTVPDWTTDTAGYDTESATGVLLGATFYRDISGGLSLRSGGYFVQRKGTLKEETTGTKTDFKISSVDVPLTLKFDVASGFGFYGGAAFSLKVSDDCSGDSAVCNEFEPENFMTSASLGVSASVHPNWIVEAGYNIGLSEAAKDLEVNTAGVQAVFIY